MATIEWVFLCSLSNVTMVGESHKILQSRERGTYVQQVNHFNILSLCFFSRGISLLLVFKKIKTL